MYGQSESTNKPSSFVIEDVRDNDNYKFVQLRKNINEETRKDEEDNSEITAYTYDEISFLLSSDEATEELINNNFDSLWETYKDYEFTQPEKEDPIKELQECILELSKQIYS